MFHCIFNLVGAVKFAYKTVSKNFYLPTLCPYAVYQKNKTKHITCNLSCLYSISLNQCCVRVQIVKSESESSPLSPSPTHHHLQVRVRLITSESGRVLDSEFKKNKFESRVQQSTYSIFLQASKTWKQHESRFLSPSPSQ